MVKGERRLDDLLAEIAGLRAALVDLADESIGAAEAIHPHFRDSARNLAHYLALRRRDLRPLQARLAELGLSSLGRSEAHVLASVDAVLGVLHRLAGSPAPAPAGGPPPFGFEAGTQLLAGHTEALLGAAPVGRNVRIMVTMPSEAAFDYALVHDLLAGGMNCMRINCAHDEPGAWLRMIEHLRRAEQALKRRCKVLMDLGGPKLRTGPLEPGPKVRKVRPQRDAFGRVTAPARIWLQASAAGADPPSEADACLPVAADWLMRLENGDRIDFDDAGGRQRQLEIVEVGPGYAWGLCANTAYFAPGVVLGKEGRHGRRHEIEVGDFAPAEGVIVLQQGDLLQLTPDDEPGEAATQDRSGRVLTPAHIGCTLPQVFADVRAGDSVWLDDGRIGGTVEKVNRTGLHVRIARARQRGEKLRADKGINLPDSPLQLPALTEQDRDDLRFIVEHADMVAMSFANSVEDVEALTAEIARLGRGTPAIVLKIETRRGFDHLPSMLLAAMRSAACGVMIARGDLAVECGYERLAEVQEEMLWICEAAHVPVIWATQVLETLAKEGIPSRAEITDAAMGHRAECVMLNKGPHILRAVQTLDDILHRMRRHQDKKRPMLRQLHLASAFAAAAPP
ncbi:MAG: pyruvate kinase [Betaproteobacteria bacterium]|nr:MAG: pyruvate kinase [Betaproteobacteria bacterium]